MSEAAQLNLRETRLARRIGRLFRIERMGGFDRCPQLAIDELIRRRGVAIAELQRLDDARREAEITAPSSLRSAFWMLADEVNASQAAAESRKALLAAELQQRRARGTTGLRDGRGSRLLGSG